MADSSPSPLDDLSRPEPPLGLGDRLRDLADELRDRIPWIAIAVLAAGAFAGGWWLTRSEPTTGPPPEATIPLATPLPTPTVAPVEITVHVAGAVEQPGVFTVDDGARVGDVVQLAGGLARDADLERINLAGPIADGQRVWIPLVGEEEPPLVAGDAPPVGTGGVDAGGTIDLNRADAASLETLPGIGPATATAIVEYRERNGPFLSVDDLLAVPGIGPAKLETIRPLAEV